MKILILRVSAIGDVVHTIPAIFLIKKIMPNAQISWIIQKKAASLLIDQPFINKVWVLPDNFLHPRKWRQTIKIIKEVKKTKWNLILDFQGIIKTSTIISFLKGLKVGFDSKNTKEKISTFFTHKHVKPTYTNIIQKNLALVSNALHKISPNNYLSSPSINNLQQNFFLYFPENIKNIVDKWIAQNKLDQFILLAPNTTWQSKHWPEENWKELLKLLSSSKIRVALIGKNFGYPAENLAKYITNKNLNITIIPAWDLLSTGYLITKSNLLIAPDTGLLHLADYLGIKTIAIFGPTSAKKHGPFWTHENIKNTVQINCTHYYQKTHGSNFSKTSTNNNCMYKLTPKDLLEKILKII